MMEGVDSSFAAVVFIGYHARAGTPNAILEHTSNGNVIDFSINGVSLPEGGYNAYGVDGIGMNPEGYPSNEQNTYIDHGFGTCRAGTADPPPSAYTNGVVTPHAAFLALRWAPRDVLTDLANLEHDFAIYDKWGFHDSVNVDTGTVSDAYLSLDQGIIMAAIGNELDGDLLRDAFATKAFTKVLRPIVALETFGAGPRDRAQTVDRP
jgi:hypothetical protein